jgi:MarR family transcriptional regulator, organic hydroperoxide resistance regulator
MARQGRVLTLFFLAMARLGALGKGALRASRAMKAAFALAEFLPYLLNRAGVKIGLSFSRDIESFGVTLPMWRVMVALWESGDQRLGDLAERTSIDFSTLSRLLVNLQRKDFIARRRSGLDGRALSVSLTDRGRAMTERIIPLARHYEEVATRGLGEADIRRLKRMLVRLFSNIKTFDEEYAKRNLQGPAKGRTSSRRKAKASRR